MNRREDHWCTLERFLPTPIQIEVHDVAEWRVYQLAPSVPFSIDAITRMLPPGLS